MRAIIKEGFISSTPMPNTGVLTIVGPERVTELDMSMSDAMRLITSAGVVSTDINLGETQG